jgi:hypothetical protein
VTGKSERNKSFSYDTVANTKTYGGGPYKGIGEIKLTAVDADTTIMTWSTDYFNDVGYDDATGWFLEKVKTIKKQVCLSIWSNNSPW